MTAYIPQRDPEMERRLNKALEYTGGTHTLEDLLDEVRLGTMQSHVYGDSWAITQILDFPRRRVLEIFLAVGHLGDMDILAGKVEEFAVAEGCTLIRTYGRRGFEATGARNGFKPVQTLFTKDIG